MSRTEWVLAAAVSALSGLVACASPASPPTAVCQTKDNCPANSHCIANACIANSPPAAGFTVTGALEANAEITLDAANSSDPDEGDSITSYAWTVTKKSGDCDAPTIAGKTQKVTVRFACAGEFEVSLTVTDGMQGVSAPSKQSVTLTPRTTPSLIEVGPDLTTDHECSGDPLICRPKDTITLAATLKDPAYQNVRWTVVPPDGMELGEEAGRTVTFQPNANAPEVTVELATNGVAISGDWTFRAELLDGEAVIDSAAMRVSIGNRPPTIEGGPAGAFGHSYAAPAYHAEGSFEVRYVDLDGDPITVSNEPSAQHSGDGRATFAASWFPYSPGTLPDTVTFRVVALDPSELIGPGVARAIVIEATDVNGGVGTSSFEVTIGNTAPQRVSSTTATPRHYYSPASSLYYAEAALTLWSDPDGDPLTFGDVTGSAMCRRVESAGALRVRCETAVLADLLRTKSLTARVTDPWQAGSLAYVNVAPQNTRPTFSAIDNPAASTTCSAAYSPGCTSGPYGGVNATLCDAYSVIIGYATDLDGDPLDLDGCASGSMCPVRVTVPEGLTCSSSPRIEDTVNYQFSDSVLATSGSVSVRPTTR